MSPQKLKILVIALLCCLVCGIVGSYLANKLTSGDYQLEEIKVDSNAALILSTMKQTSSRNGIKEWELEAKSARLLKNENKALLDTISVTFHLNDGSRVHATANKGILYTATQDMTFSGSVTLIYSASKLMTDELHYQKENHIIYSQVRVRITNNTSSLQGDTLRFDLNRNIIQMKGRVEADFSKSLLNEGPQL